MILCVLIRIDYMILRESVHEDRELSINRSIFPRYDHNDTDQNNFIEEVINESLYFPMGYG